MKFKTISVILSVMLMGGLGAGQNITVVDNHVIKKNSENRETRHTTIEALFLGDVCLGTSFGGRGRFQDVYDKKGAEYFFSGVKGEFENKDLIVANLENVFTNNKNYR
ncbi:MAG TPA: hypothetical protein VFD17_02645, partial [Clostridia bacterium]|nr:hypothetical protein [Clostridia bacterium]